MLLRGGRTSLLLLEAKLLSRCQASEAPRWPVPPTPHSYPQHTAPARTCPAFLLQELCNKIIAGQYTAPDWLSASMKDLLSRMLTTDPDKRITFPQVSRSGALCSTAATSVKNENVPAPSLPHPAAPLAKPSTDSPPRPLVSPLRRCGSTAGCATAPNGTSAASTATR